MVDRTICKPDPLGDNLCIFAAMYNSLRDDETRRAFAMGDVTGSGQHFKNFVFDNLKKCNPGLVAAKESEGFNVIDMQKYLRELVAKNFINRFTWKGCTAKDWSMDRLNKVRGKESYILFAYGLNSDERNAIK